MRDNLKKCQMLPPFDKGGPPNAPSLSEAAHQILPPLSKGGWGGFMVDALPLIPPTGFPRQSPGAASDV